MGERLKIKRDVDGVPLLSESPVSALVDTHGQVRIYGGLAGIADANKMVRVLFGVEKLHEDFENKPCDEKLLEGVRSPMTPSPR